MTCAQHQVGERLLHRLHPARGARLHDRVDLLDLRLPDQVADRVVGHQDLERGRPAAAVGGRHEVLRDDALERRRELDAHLALLLGGEDVDDAVDRGRRALGVQRREHEVPGLGRGERGRDRLEVAHLADEDHVGVLAERGAQPLAEPGTSEPISRWLTMQRWCQVQELDRVLDREDVLGRVVVDLVDQRRERRRLARPGRAGHEHEPARLLAQIVEPLGMRSSSSVRIAAGISRNAAPTLERWK